MLSVPLGAEHLERLLCALGRGVGLLGWLCKGPGPSTPLIQVWKRITALKNHAFDNLYAYNVGICAIYIQASMCWCCTAAFLSTEQAFLSPRPLGASWALAPPCAPLGGAQ
jgi:hypothetical protein